MTPVVLNVDDYALGRYARTQVLRAAGLLVREAGTAAEALQAIEIGDTELVILDIGLPDMSGLELCRRLKLSPDTAGIPVLQVSATFTTSRDAVVALDGGADAFLVQPVDPDVLVATVKSLLRVRRAEEALHRVAREWQTTFDTIGDGVAIVDAFGRLVRWNAAFEKTFASYVPDLTGISLDEVWDAASAVTGDRTGTFELNLDAAWFRVNLHPMNGSGSVCVVTDITERRHADDERRRLLAQEQAARQEAEAANRAKDHFLGVVSHELRTPLTPVVGWVRILRDFDVDPAIRTRALDSIERNVKLQARLIEDLLDVSRIIAGKLALDFRPVSLSGVVDAAVESSRPAASAKGIALLVAADGTIGPVIGDQARLQQILGNLLSNAIKFTPPGGRVELAVTQTSDIVEVVVRDTGKGIPPEALSQIFDRFWQADSGPSARHQGLGLGLTIVRHLIELHGGSVRAESDGVGEGAVFTVTLPSTRDAVAPAPGSPSRDDGVPQLLGRARVLLVEDDQDAREMLRLGLETFGADVVSVDCGEAALQAVVEVAADVLVSDIGLRDIDGYELVRRLRRLSAQQGGLVPAIALTGYARSEDRDRALAAGFQAHVSKPVDPEALAAIIASLL